MKNLRRLLFGLPVVLTIAAMGASGPQPGDVDQSFDAGSTLNRTVYAIAMQTNGQAVIAGNFTQTHGLPQSGLARITAEGETDYNFAHGKGQYAVVIQPDGKIVSGWYGKVMRWNPDGSTDAGFQMTAVNSFPANHIAIQADGKILIAASYGISRFNANGTTDTSFKPVFNGAVYWIVLQPDGKVLICGEFTSANSVPRHSVARLNTDGTLDTSFQDPLCSDSVQVLALRADGKMLIVGYFYSINGVPRNNIARLNSNGSLDTTFQDGLDGTASSGNAYAMALQPDGKVLIGGSFTTINGIVRNGIARLNTDGSLDTSFQNGMAGAGDACNVECIALQTDGKVLIGGGFTTVNGAPRRYLARLNSDGSLDSTYQNGRPGTEGASAPPVIHSLVLEPDGKLLVGGLFDTINGQARTNIALLATNGLLDSFFLNGQSGIGSGNGVFSTCRQADGKLLIGGRFDAVDGVNRNNLARLNSNGSLDLTFPTSVSLRGQTYAAWIYAIALQTNGKIIVAGNFDAVGAVTRNGIARLNSNGTLDGTFLSGLSGALIGTDAGTINALAVQPDGKILIGGIFDTVNGISRKGIARLNVDGSLDNAFQNGMSGASPGEVNTILIQFDGNILIGGDFPLVNDIPRSGIARLHMDGTLDASFQADFQARTFVIAQQLDGKLLLGGSFQITNGVDATGLARLNHDGSLDTTFWSQINQGFVYAIAIQADGNALVAGEFSSINGVLRPNIARIFTMVPKPWLSTSKNPGNPFSFNIGGYPNQVVVIEASTNLQTWFSLRTNTLGSVPLPFTDPASSSFPHRFYRARLQ